MATLSAAVVLSAPAGQLSSNEQTLARVSDISLYVTMGVLTLALAAFALHLAIHASVQPRRVKADRQAEDRTLAGVGGTGPVIAPADEPQDEMPASAADLGGGAPGETAAQTAARSRRWGVIGTQALWLATLALAVCVVTRTLAVGRAPLGNMYEFALVTALTSLAIYAVWSLRRELLWLGLFVSGISLLILGAALRVWYVPAGPLMPALNDSIWLVIHVITASISIGIFVVGAVLAALYLVKDRAETKGTADTGWVRALPKATVIERITYATHIVAFPLFTFTVIAGAIWAEEAWGRYWNWDPKEIWSFVIWVVYAIYLHARATSGVTLRRSAWFALAGFACIVINYTIVNTVINSLHSYSGL